MAGPPNGGGIKELKVKKQTKKSFSKGIGATDEKKVNFWVQDMWVVQTESTDRHTGPAAGCVLWKGPGAEIE